MQHELPPGFRPLNAPAVTKAATKRAADVTPEYVGRAERVEKVIKVGIAIIGWSSIIVIIVGMALAIRGIMALPYSDERTIGDAAAFRAAREFIQSAYPGLEKLDGRSSAMISRQGTTWTVRVDGSGRNVFNGPVRNGFLVTMDDVSGTLHKRSIEIVDPAVVTSYR